MTLAAVALAGLLTGVQPLDADLRPRQPWSEGKRAETLYLTCAAVDLASTAVGLNNGLKEGNPIIRGDSDRETLIRAAALKLGFYAFAKLTKAPPWAYRLAGYPQCVAAAWNTGQVIAR